MKFTEPAGTNPIDRMTVVGRAQDRIDGPRKTTGMAAYAYEHHKEAPNAAYGWIIGAAVAKGRIRSMNLDDARGAPGVLAIVTANEAGPLGKGNFNTVKLLGGPDIDHYHQAVAIVVAESFEQARAAAGLVRIDYERGKGQYDLAEGLKSAPLTGGEEGKPGKEDRTGSFESAFTAAPVKLDATYTTPDHSHAMMEPFASIASWEGDKLTVWTSNQMIAWGHGDLAKTLGLPKEKVRLISPYVGGGFGGKLFLRADAVMA
ncbi:MAG TPA: molybdopterin cofactor-binding domain-containing protein, partial [Sphingomonas sanguinis]